VENILERGLIRLLENDEGIAEIFNERLPDLGVLLNTYMAEIELFNPAYGLVKVDGRRDLIVKHILDSLAPLGIISRLLRKAEDRAGAASLDPPPLKLADVGSGAGLPGIPLAIVLPDVHFTLIERMGRRAGFLRNTQTALGLSNITVEEREMEKAPPGRFSLVTFRAFRPLEPKILKGLFRLCAGGGTLAAYKGRRDKTEEEMAAAEKTAGLARASWEIIPCPVPFLDEERHLLVIKN
jgi:16S rRNA (guanine527-N7)-methyltransferase